MSKQDTAQAPKLFIGMDIHKKNLESTFYYRPYISIAWRST